MDLALDQALRGRGFLPSLAQVGVGHRLQVVEVVEEDARQARNRGVDVAGHRDVDEEERPLAALGAGRLHVGARDDEAGGSRPADHDVGPGQLGAERLEGRRPAAQSGRELLGLLERAPAQDGGPRPVAHQVPGRQLAHLARPHQEDVALAKLAEDLQRQLHRHRGDRDRVPADTGLAAHSLGGGDRPVAKCVQDRPQRPRLLRNLVGLLHLPEDLGLTEHHGIEAGRHPERVVHGRVALQPVEGRLDLGERTVVELGEEGNEGTGPRLPRMAVDLHPVAGGKHHRFLEADLGAQAVERLRQAVFRERQGLAHRDRGRTMAQADDQDHLRITAAATPGVSDIQTNVKTTAPKPTMPRRAARLPPQPARWRAEISIT